METTYREARAVLEAQQTTLADVDEKAMRTVRTTVLLIGAIASAVKVARSEFHAGLATLGSVFLFGSLALGLATYDETDPYLGPNQRYIDQLAANEFRGTWEQDLVETYGYWIKKNGEEWRRHRVQRSPPSDHAGTSLPRDGASLDSAGLLESLGVAVPRWGNKIPANVPLVFTSVQRTSWYGR